MKTIFKRLVTLLPLLLMLILIQPTAWAADKLKVVTSTQDLASITRAIGGDKVEVFALANGTQNPHFVPAKPSYILKLKDADMLVVVGMELETWLPPLVESSRNSNLFRGGSGYVDASQGMPLLGVPIGRVDRSMGDVHGFGNPHYWLDPVNAKTISANIANGLKRLDPEHAGYYESQRQQFLKQLASHVTQWLTMAKPLKGTKILAYHDSWPYFVKRFGLQVVGFVEPKPGIAPSPKHVQAMIEKAKAENVSMIIMEPYFSRSAPNMIAKATGAKVVVLPPSVGGAAGADSYFSLFDTQLNALLKAR